VIEMKLSALKKKALIAVLMVIPAITSGVISYMEARSSSRSDTQETEEKAEAGYQVTKAAYEQLITDISALKAEVQILHEIVLSTVHRTSAIGPYPELPAPDV